MNSTYQTVVAGLMHDQQIYIYEPPNFTVAQHLDLQNVYVGAFENTLRQMDELQCTGPLDSHVCSIHWLVYMQLQNYLLISKVVFLERMALVWGKRSSFMEDVGGLVKKIARCDLVPWGAHALAAAMQKVGECGRWLDAWVVNSRGV